MSRRSTVATLAIVAAIGCGGESVSGTPGTPSGSGGQSPTVVKFVAGEGLTDTIQAQPNQGLLIRVTGADGKARSGVMVQVSSSPGGGTSGQTLSIGLAGKTPRQFAVSDTTNADGEIPVRLVFGSRAGAYTLFAAVASFGLIDSTAIVVSPGNAARVIVLSKDTAAFVGTTLTPRATATDRAGNSRPDVLTYRVVSGQGTATGSGLTLDAVGPLRAVAQLGSFVDTILVRVVPAGTIVACQCPDTRPFRTLVTLRLDGSARTQLAVSLGDGVYGDMAPSWSPDGLRIAYSDILNPASDEHLFLIDATGTPRRLVIADANGPSQQARPSWSSMSDWIYFQGKVGQDPVLWRVHSDGSGLEELTPTEPFTSTDFDPAVSPDGTQLVYATNREGDTFSSYLRIMNTATRSIVSLATQGNRPAWSPAGDWIAFLQDDAVGNHRLAIIRPDGTGYRALSTPGYVFYERPAWSPDGKYLVGQSPIDRFVIVDVATSAVMELPYAAQLAAPIWRP
jgi:hypothetical protein